MFICNPALGYVPGTVMSVAEALSHGTFSLQTTQDGSYAVFSDGATFNASDLPPSILDGSAYRKPAPASAPAAVVAVQPNANALIGPDVIAAHGGIVSSAGGQNGTYYVTRDGTYFAESQLRADVLNPALAHALDNTGALVNVQTNQDSSTAQFATGVSMPAQYLPAEITSPTAPVVTKVAPVATVAPGVASIIPITAAPATPSPASVTTVAAPAPAPGNPTPLVQSSSGQGSGTGAGASLPTVAYDPGTFGAPNVYPGSGSSQGSAPAPASGAGKFVLAVIAGLALVGGSGR
jgi:hypothetical protein